MKIGIVPIQMTWKRYGTPFGEDVNTVRSLPCYTRGRKRRCHDSFIMRDGNRLSPSPKLHIQRGKFKVDPFGKILKRDKPLKASES